MPQPIRAHQEEVPKVRTLPIKELARPRRQLLQELVLAQPHLVHDMSRPEVQETARSSQAKSPISSQSNGTQTTPLQGVARAPAALSTAEHTLDEVEVMEVGIKPFTDSLYVILFTDVFIKSNLICKFRH